MQARRPAPPPRALTLAGPLSLSLRYRRLCAKSEVTAVDISPRAASAFAIHAAPQGAQSWIDFFDPATQRGYAKATGSYAVLEPLVAPAPPRQPPPESEPSPPSPPPRAGAGARASSLASSLVSSLARLGEHGFADAASASRDGARRPRVAILRDLTVQLGQGVEYRHNSTVVIHDLSTGKTPLEMRDAARGPIAWSRNGLLIAAGEASPTSSPRVGVWDSRTGARAGRVVSHIDDITHAAFAADDRLVTLSRDGTARLTDVATGRTLSRLEVEAGGRNPRLLAVSADGGTVVSLWGTAVHVWVPATSRLASYDLRGARRTEGWPLCLSPDGRWMACRTERAFDVLDAASGAVAWEPPPEPDAPQAEPASTDDMVTAAAFSADGRVLLLGRISGAVEVWDVAEKTE